jgi:magnesium-transporting ATPase (P-type)
MSAGVSDPPAAPAADATARDWHARDVAAALEELGTPAGGLSAPEAAARLAAVGPNATGGRGGDPAGRVLLRQLANPLIAVLLVSGAIAIALGDLVDGAVVLGSSLPTR